MSCCPDPSGEQQFMLSGVGGISHKPKHQEAGPLKTVLNCMI